MNTNSHRLSPPEDEIKITAIRARGAGGQNVNKVASAVHLRFDIQSSSLPGVIKRRLMRCKDRRITKNGIVVIKAQEYRTLEKNKSSALLRLTHLIRTVDKPVKKRKPTRPTRGATQRRMDSKAKRGKLKKMRRKIAVRTE